MNVFLKKQYFIIRIINLVQLTYNINYYLFERKKWKKKKTNPIENWPKKPVKLSIKLMLKNVKNVLFMCVV